MDAAVRARRRTAGARTWTSTRATATPSNRFPESAGPPHRNCSGGTPPATSRHNDGKSGSTCRRSAPSPPPDRGHGGRRGAGRELDLPGDGHVLRMDDGTCAAELLLPVHVSGAPRARTADRRALRRVRDSSRTRRPSPEEPHGVADRIRPRRRGARAARDGPDSRALRLVRNPGSACAGRGVLAARAAAHRGGGALRLAPRAWRTLPRATRLGVVCSRGGAGGRARGRARAQPTARRAACRTKAIASSARRSCGRRKGGCSRCAR